MAKVQTYEDSTVWIEVQEIFKNSQGTRLFDFKGTVHTPKEDLGVWDLNNIEAVRDYLKNVSDAKTVSFKVGLGDYVNRIYPHRHNLEFTVRRTPMQEAGSKVKTTEKISITRYKAIFNPKRNPPVGISDLQMQQIEALNSTDMVELLFELVDRSMEPLRIKTTSGSFKKLKVEDFIRATMGYESMQITIDGKPAVEALDIVKPNNLEPAEHIVVPPGVHVTAIPSFVQSKIGVYNRGIGNYFQVYRNKKTWFVYPVYDTFRFDNSDTKAVFYAVPQDKMPSMDRTYWEDGKVLKVAVTAQRLYTDTAELAMMNQGSGFRMADARAFMAKPVKFTEEGPEGDRSRTNHEVVGKQRDDGLNYAPVNRSGPSSNPFVEKSKVLEQSLAQIDFVWENANEELIYPGMPCKYVYLNQGKAVSLKGTVLFVHHYSARLEKYGAQAYKTTARIGIVCEPQSHDPELSFRGVEGEDWYARPT